MQVSGSLPFLAFRCSLPALSSRHTTAAATAVSALLLANLTLNSFKSLLCLMYFKKTIRTGNGSFSGKREDTQGEHKLERNLPDRLVLRSLPSRLLIYFFGISTRRPTRSVYRWALISTLGSLILEIRVVRLRLRVTATTAVTAACGGHRRRRGVLIGSRPRTEQRCRTCSHSHLLNQGGRHRSRSRRHLIASNLLQGARESKELGEGHRLPQEAVLDAPHPCGAAIKDIFLTLTIFVTFKMWEKVDGETQLTPGFLVSPEGRWSRVAAALAAIFVHPVKTSLDSFFVVIIMAAISCS